MKFEELSSEVLINEVMVFDISTNIVYCSIFKEIKKHLNDFFKEKKSEIISVNIYQEKRVNDDDVSLVETVKSYDSTAFTIKIMKNFYEKNEELYDDFIDGFIKEVSRLSREDVIHENNILRKFPSLLKIIQEKNNIKKIKPI